MTNLKAVAERVFNLFLREPYDGYFNDKPDEQLKSEIESLLREVVEDVAKRMRGQCYSKLAEKDLRKARAEAFREAAEIAEEHNGCTEKSCMQDSNCPVTIANWCRFKADESGGYPKK